MLVRLKTDKALLNWNVLYIYITNIKKSPISRTRFVRLSLS